MRTSQPPTEIDDPNAGGAETRGTRYDHPAFGQIGASRVQGSRTLYGTDFVHHAFVSIRISHSQLTRTLSHDWHYANDEIVSIDLSEAQWATFVSSLNVGQGVPCTIDHLQGRPLPGITPHERDTQFKNEVRGTLTEALAEVAAAIEQVSAATIPKTKRESILSRLTKAAQHLRSNLPFVADSFDKHVEATVEAAKIEVNAYLTHAVTQAGLDVLRAPIARDEPKLIEGDKK